MTIEFKTQTTISPSSINTFFKCPRNYFFTYIAKLPRKPNIHMVKGTIVHKTLEDFFRVYKPNFDKTMATFFIKAWNSNKKVINMLELTTKELITHKQDCINMVNTYLSNFKTTVNNLIESEKAENEAHAFYLLKPKFKELKVEDKELHCKGFIDRVHINYDGILTIGDYKTSSWFGLGLPEDNKRQLSVYALLYKNQEKKTPDYTAVIFLRYGIEVLLEVTPSLLRYARNIITDVYAKTRSVDIKDYPKKESALCKWCNFMNICDGHEDWESIKRKEEFKKQIKKNDTLSSSPPTKTKTSSSV